MASHAEAPAIGACSTPWRSAIGKLLGWQPGQEAVVAEACRPWGLDHATVLVAMAYTSKDADAQLQEDQKTQLVAMVDTRSQHVLASHQQSVAEDALVVFGPHSLALDTARYQLSDRVRAFGVRFNSSALGASCPEASWADELTLFAPRGRALQPVLHLAMQRQRAVKSCISTQAEGAAWDVAELTLAVLPNRTNGLADLRVTATIRRETNDGMVRSASPLVEHAVLKFGPAGYKPGDRRPWWLRSH